MFDAHQDVGPSVIDLELTDEIRDKQFVTQISCSFGMKSVILKLNGKHENKVIELYPIITGKEEWANTLDSCVGTLKDRGVDDEGDRTALRWCLNQNSEKIANHFAEQQLARMTAGQKAKMERIKSKNRPPIELSIKDVLRRHEGNFQVKGMINGLGIVEKMYNKVGFRCGECDHINVKFDYIGSRPRFIEEIPRLKLSEMKCVCQSAEAELPFSHEPWDDPVNALKIVLFDTETYNDLESLNVVLLDDYTRNVQTGEQVTVTGSLQRVTVRGKTQSYLFVGLNEIDGVENPLVYQNRKQSIHDLTEDDERKVLQQLPSVNHESEMTGKESPKEESSQQQMSITNQNILEHNSKDNNLQEDYENYITRQKKIFGSLDQKLAARQIFNELAFKNKNEKNPGQENEVLESKFREALGFEESSIDMIIEDMVKDRIVERVVTELDGVRYNILRKVIDSQ